MILPDVNALVYAHHRDSELHEEYAEWLTGVVAGSEELALADHCLIGVVRIVTNPRIFSKPARTATALAFVDRLQAAPRSRQVAATSATWSVLNRLAADDRGLKGVLVPDAYLAALSITHGCRLATADRGFARFPGLDFFDPVA